MQFNNHSRLEGLHAPFSPSQSSWLRYNDSKIVDFYTNKKASEMGTKLHEWAKTTIDLGIRQPRSNKTLSAYVNDAIGFKMSTEVVLYHSDRVFGTADAISFRKGPNGRYILRIHDLKTGKVGKIESHIEQLEIYAALFCLEYKVKPNEIDMELRVYKNDQVLIHKPTPEDINSIMDIIIHIDKVSEKIDEEA